MESILAIKDLSIQIKDRILFRNANFSVNPGDAVLLSGPNGIGKSTLLKSILQLETAEKTIKGEIIVRRRKLGVS